MESKTIRNKLKEIGGVQEIDGDAFGVRNQLIIHCRKGKAFQSYQSIIAIKDKDGRVFLGEDWDYSTTTGKYRNQFLGEKKADTEKRIKSGEYTLLNGK